MTFAGIRTPIELRLITRAHVIAWRKDLDHRKLAPGSVRRKLSALSSLYEYLTDQNAVPTNPVKGVKRPKVDSYEGKTPAIADKEARQLMNLPTRQDPQRPSRSRLTRHPALSRPAPRRTLPPEDQGHPPPPRRPAPASPRQRQQDPLHPAARRHARITQRLPGRSPPRRRHRRRPLPTRQQQPHRRARQHHHARRRLQTRAPLRPSPRPQDRRPRAARHRRHQRPRSRSRYCQGPGMAGPRQYRDHPNLRPAQNEAGRLADL